MTAEISERNLSMKESAIRFNQEGVALFSEGKFSAALDNFRFALSFFGTDTQSRRDARVHQDRLGEGEILASESSCSESSCHFAEMEMEEDKNTVDGLLLKPISVKLQWNINTIILVALFNLSLAKHAELVSMGESADKNTTMMNTTLQLYESTYMMLRRTEETTNVAPDSSLSNELVARGTILFTTLHNIGVIHSQLGSEDDARIYFEWLYMNILAVHDNGSVHLFSPSLRIDILIARVVKELWMLKDAITAPCA
jgi:hypothetical protein